MESLFRPHPLVDQDLETLGIIRARVRFYEASDRFQPGPANWKAQKALFPTLRLHWPEIDKTREFRHAILMALLGRPIETQHSGDGSKNGLLWHEVKSLLEVLNNESIFPVDGGCAGRIQMAVEGEAAGKPWSISARYPGG